MDFKIRSFGDDFFVMMMMDVAVTVMMMRARLFDFGTTRTTTTTSSSSVVGSRRVGGQSRRGNRFPFLVMMVSVMVSLPLFLLEEFDNFPRRKTRLSVVSPVL